MTRIQVHPDEMIKNAELISKNKHQLEMIFHELEKTMHFLQSDWSGMTHEEFFRNFREVKEYIFPSFLGLLSTFQKKLQEEARAFRAVDSSTGEVRIIPSPPEPSFLTGLIDKAIGDTVIGLSDTIVSFFNNPLSTLGDVGYDLTIGKIVDVGRGFAFAWDTAWGTGTARSDIEEFVNEQKKQLEEDESGYYKGAVIGKAASYFLFGKALHSKNHNGSGGSNGSSGSGDGKKEPEKGSDLNHNGKIRVEGTKTIYTNSFGNEISWTNQGPKDIDAIIEKNLKSSIDGDILEGQVAQTVKGMGRLQGTAIQLYMKDDTKAGDVDILTDSHLIEVKKSLSAVSKKQFNKLTDPMDEKFFNFNNREVIYYIEDTTVKNKTQENILKMIEEKGVKIVSSTSDLEEVMKK